MRGFTLFVTGFAGTVVTHAVSHAVPRLDHSIVSRDKDNTSSTPVRGLDNGTTVLGFWGGRGTVSRPLSEVCSNGSFDVINLSFVTSLNPPTFITNATKWILNPTDGTVLSTIEPSLADQVTGCQQKGIKIMISFGGDPIYSSATFNSAAEAEDGAKYMWNLFLGGTECQDIRPLGNNVVLDGVDLDNETGDGAHYFEFVKALRGFTGTRDKASDDGLRPYYISGDPMASNHTDILGNSTSIPGSILPELDWIVDQSYNSGDDSIGGSGFEDATRAWAEELLQSGTKLLLGLPGAEGMSTSGIQDAQQVSDTISTVKSWNLGCFGGVGLWDAHAAMGNPGFLGSITSSLAA